MVIETKDIITISIAVVGWSWAIIQFCVNRKWQKKDFLKQQRFAAYKSYMSKVDEISNSMRHDPHAEITTLLKDFLPRVISGDVEDIENSVLEFNNRLLDYVKESIKPLSIVNQELNELSLLASDDLVKKIDELRLLSTDLSNEMQNNINQINLKEPESFKALETVGHNERWKRFSSLNDEIFALMRKELNVK